MDRRSWLWRRKSSEKSPGETESSGSISSQYERFSDDQAHPIFAQAHSPEVNSKVAVNDVVEVGADVKTLSEKLSAALLSANAKEALVKQHARVAEEAVEGWEKAEKEVASLKLQLEAQLKKNSALEDRVGHLDGALKECVRQLSQAKDHQEEKLQEAISRRNREWESIKTELENQLADLRQQMEMAKLDAAKSIQELRPKLDASEKENSSLKLELLKTSQRLEVRTLERDLSAQTAESASKQHLESMKKVSKLEAECRRLKSSTRKASFASDQKSSSAYADSITDAQSDHGEKLQLVEHDVKNVDITVSKDQRKTAVTESGKVGLMDDFLEMERLASLTEEEHKRENPSDIVDGGENPLKTELDSMISRTSFLEEKIDKLEAEKLDLEKALCDYKDCLETSQSELVDAQYRMVELEAHLTECQSQLKISKGEIKDSGFGLTELKFQLLACQEQLKTAQGQLKDKESELFALRTDLFEHQKQLKISDEKLHDKENELVNLKTQVAEQQEEITTSQWKVRDKESNLTMLQTQLTHGEGQLRISQEQLKEAEQKLTDIQTQLTSTNELNQVIETELKASNAKREKVELQAKALESKTNDLLAKVSILEEVAKKERVSSAEVSAKCQELEKELLKIKKGEARPQLTTRGFNQNMKAEQEKELAVAASRLAECQQTIASLGKQLKSLSSLDDLFVELEPETLHESSGEVAAVTQLLCRKSEVGRLPSIGCQ